MAKFYIATFGCQMNVNDSLWLSRTLVSYGHEEANPKEADFFILNTCSVREKPEKKVHSILGQLRKINPNMWGIVMGCVAQQLGNVLLQRHSNVKLVLGTDAIDNAPEQIEKILSESFSNPQKKTKISLTEFSTIFPDRAHHLGEEKNSAQKKKQAVAYVNIMQGCDNFCAYCIVPYTRGVPKSRSTQSILDECKAWIDQGAKEIMLLGQNVNAFGLDRLSDGVSFPKLLQMIDKLEGLERLRFMTPHPKDLADDTIKLFGDLKTLCPRVHLPIQAGSNNVLQEMNRKYTQEYFLDRVQKLKEVRNDLVIASDIIVGFPGETEEDFQESLKVMKEAPIIFSYSFAYSDRPGTKATSMTNKIPKEIQFERLERLQNLQTELSENYLQSLVGQELELLIEGQSKKSNSAMSRDIYGNTVHVPSEKEIGTIIKAKITQAHSYSLTAEEL